MADVIHLTIVLTLILLSYPLAAQEWRSVGVLNVPRAPYSFLAATPQGNLIATVHNNAPSNSAPQPRPAYLIVNPTTASPQVNTLSNVEFEPQRGYGGVACDLFGAFYVTGDTGDRSSSFIRKYQPNGQPDTSFGQGGAVFPGYRCLGVQVMGRYLVVAVDWGEVLVLDSSNGSMLGQLPKADGEYFLRDIALDPSTMDIYGVSEGAVISWTGGAPWLPDRYQFQQNSDKNTEPKSGEGISFDPSRRLALITPIGGNTLLSVNQDGSVEQTIVRTAKPDAHLADSVLSFDGQFLFISDIRDQKIHVMRRQLPQPEELEYPSGAQQQVAGSASGGGAYQATQASGYGTPAARPTPAPTAAQSAAPTWHRSYTQVVEQSRREGKPMLLYFRKDGLKKCLDFESNILLSPEFNQRANRFTCVFEDVGANPLLAYQFGVFRVPHLVLLDSRGQPVRKFVFNINTASLFRALENF
jgi:hypothetical protein